jgi:hypothetical protein
MIHLSPEISCDVLQQNVKIKHENWSCFVRRAAADHAVV